MIDHYYLECKAKDGKIYISEMVEPCQVAEKIKFLAEVSPLIDKIYDLMCKYNKIVPD